MSNTVIQLKWSETTSTPPSLNVAEPAYSNTSNKLFIGLADNTVVAIGGKYYTDIVDAATSSSTINTLVKRDGDGSFSANVVSVDTVVVGGGSGGDITGANTVHANYFYGSLATPTGVVEDTYGSSTAVPIIAVAANGLITSVTTASISTSLNLAGDDSSSGSLSLVDDTLTLQGGDGISAVFVDANNTFVIDVDNTVIRTSFDGTQTIASNLSVTGNLVVSGTTTYVNTAINQTYDSMIELAANNVVGDVLDIGFYGKHEGMDGVVVTGLVRNAGTSDYYLFDNIGLGDQEEISANVITQASMTANGASLYAKQFLASDIGLTGGYSFNTGTPTGMFSEADGRLQFFVNGAIAGEINSNNGNTAIGLLAAETGQGYRATAIGYGAGQNTQSSFATAVGLHAGQTFQGTAAVAVGHSAGQDNQSQDAVAVGSHAGQNTQGYMATAIGYRAGYGADSGQGQYSVAVGAKAGRVSQHEYSIAINASGNDLTPTEAGLYIDPIRANNATGGNVTVYNTTTKEVVYTDVIIDSTGIKLANDIHIIDSANSVVMGQNVDLSNSNANRVAIGYYAGETGQNYGSVAVGKGAGQTSQGGWSTAVGLNAGNTGQGSSAVAVGHRAGGTNQGGHTVAVGVNAGQNTQGVYATAVGHRAGYGGTTAQGEYSLALGYGAGTDSQAAYSIALNASASALNPTNAGFYVNPIRYVETQDATYDGLAFYNSSTKEMTYSYVLSGGSF
jgi:hypothetical protein